MHRFLTQGGLALLPLALAALPVPAGAADTATEKIGVAEFRVDDLASGRSLAGAAWYPTASIGRQTLVEDGRVWKGFEAVRAAAPEAGPFPLVILSHGWTGNWRNEAWLATALARRGAIVAAPDHPGTTSLDHASAETPKLWERARDIGRVVDGLAADPRFAGRIDATRIAVIGHSMGGWTAVAVAGGRVDMALADADCAAHPELASCRWLAEHADRSAAARALYEQDLRDPRVRAAVSLDLGLTGAFSPASLAAVEVPLLVLAAGGENAELPAELESRRLAARLPAATTTYVEYPDAGHFSFVRECQPNGAEVVKRVDPGEEYVCRDGVVAAGTPTRSRAELHAAMLEDIDRFLTRAGILRRP